MIKYLAPLAACAGLVWLAGCPIAPDNFGDAGPDSGIEIIDGGADAGFPTGTASCTVTASNYADQGTQLAASWNGLDLAGSSFTQTDTGYTLYISASNVTAGVLSITYDIDSSDDVTLTAFSYTPPSGFFVEDSWSCPASTDACSAGPPDLTINGLTASGTFLLNFGNGASTSGDESAQLTSGSFSVTFP